MKHLLFVLISALVCSCGSGFKTSKRNVRAVTSFYSGSVSNHPYKVMQTNQLNKSLLELFEVYDSAQSRISLSFNKNELLLTYLAQGKPKTLAFKGKFTRRGYYEVYLRNKRTEIPPFVPVFYSQVDVKRIRLILTPENDLLVDDSWQRTGNIFILAGGGSGRTQSVFKADSSSAP